MKTTTKLVLLMGLGAGFTFSPIGGASAQAADTGKERFEERCMSCHALDTNKQGPRLGGVFGRTSGTVTEFEYSEVLKRAKVVWDADKLDKWLANPEGLVPDNNMYYKVDEPDVRAAIITYLKSQRPK